MPNLRSIFQKSFCSNKKRYCDSENNRILFFQVRLLSCICSIAADNSVALLNIKEQRCHLLASQHPYPVTQISWRPLHDFMLVRLTNGDVYIWEMETGHLDRVVGSSRAEAILSACNIEKLPGQVDVPVQSRKKNRHVMQQLHKRLKMHTPVQSPSNTPRGTPVHAVPPPTPQPPFKLPQSPIHFQPLHLSSVSVADALVAYIDIETLIVTLSSEKLLPENGRTTATTQSASPRDSPLLKRNNQSVANQPIPNQASRLVKLLFSILHSWGLVPDIDKELISRFNVHPLKMDVSPPCFAAIVSGTLFSLLPGWQAILNKRTKNVGDNSVQQGSSTNPFSKDLIASSDSNAWSLRCYWAAGAMITASRLMPLVSLANAADCLEQTLSHLPVKQPVAPPRPPPPSASQQQPAPGGPPPKRPPPPAKPGQDAQLWLQISTMYTVLLPDLIGKKYKSPPIQTLANRFHDQCLPVREAAQALLSAELSRIGPEGRRKMVETWAPYLPLVSGSTNNPTATLSAGLPQFLSSSESLDDLHDLVCPTLKAGSTFRQYDAVDLRRLQAIAVILLSFIGSDFGQAVVSPSSKDTPAMQQQMDRQQQQAKPIVEGFSVADGNLAQITASALAHLVASPIDQLNSLAAVRRAAAALIGRGFAIWEPYLDISQVLLALLNLCPAATLEQHSAWNAFLATSEHHQALAQFVPLSPATDASRTARHALSLIASARPKQFIVSIATEVRRFYASLASQPSLGNLSALSQGTAEGNDPKSPVALLYSRNEIMRLLDTLVERNPNDVCELLLEAVDIAVFCIDPSALRGRQLMDFIPHLARIPAVAFCIHSQRIAVGGRTGLLVFYEPPKNVSSASGTYARFLSQAVNAHAGQAVTEVMFSPDGRHLASYSAGHRKVSFWQPASSSLFSSSSSQLMKLVRSIPAPNVAMEQIAAAQRALPRLLFWSDRSTLHLRLGTGPNDEYKFSL